MLKGYQYNPPNRSPALQVVRESLDTWTVGATKIGRGWTPIRSFADEGRAVRFRDAVGDAFPAFRIAGRS